VSRKPFDTPIGCRLKRRKQAISHLAFALDIRRQRARLIHSPLTVTEVSVIIQAGMKATKAGKNGEARKRLVPNRGFSAVLTALKNWLFGLRPSRFVLALVTVIALSALLLIPIPHQHSTAAISSSSRTILSVAAHGGALVSDHVRNATNQPPAWPERVSATLRLSYSLVVGVFLLVALMVGFVSLYLVRFDPKLYQSTAKLALLSILVGLGVLCVKAGAMMLGTQLT